MLQVTFRNVLPTEKLLAVAHDWYADLCAAYRFEHDEVYCDVLVSGAPKAAHCQEPRLAIEMRHTTTKRVLRFSLAEESGAMRWLPMRDSLAKNAAAGPAFAGGARATDSARYGGAFSCG